MHLTFPKDAYNPKECIKIFAVIDNSTCDKELQSVKIKLFRDIIGYAENGKKFSESKVVAKRTYPGVKARQSRN